MSSPLPGPSIARPQGLSAWALRGAGWAALIVVTVRAAHSTAAAIAAGMLMAAAAVAYHLSGEDRPRWIRRPAVVASTVCGLVAIPLAPAGLAEVPVVLAATALPFSFTGRALTVATALDTVGFAAAVGWASHSLGGVLGGVGIVLLVQRAVQRMEIRAERDRAQALLAELQAAREAEQRAVALRERSRIARDMHDVLAHSLAGLSLHLQAVRAIAARQGAGPELTEPLDTAARLAREGLDEARAAVAALRDPTTTLGVEAVPTLVSRFPGQAALEVSGEAGRVAAEAGHALYRAVQEALTNAARYAPGAPVTVALDWSRDRLRARVTDAGSPGGRSGRPGQGAGLGLAGMAERVEATGGSVHAGPTPDGGWTVDVSVPAEAS